MAAPPPSLNTHRSRLAESEAAVVTWNVPSVAVMLTSLLPARTWQACDELVPAEVLAFED
jgi:hypothetical protein